MRASKPRPAARPVEPRALARTPPAPRAAKRRIESPDSSSDEAGGDDDDAAARPGSTEPRTRTPVVDESLLESPNIFSLEAFRERHASAGSGFVTHSARCARCVQLT